MIYMLVYVPLIFPSTWILNRWGLRTVCLCASILTAFGAWIKTISNGFNYPYQSFTNRSSIEFKNKVGFPLVMLGQTLCGTAQIFILGIPAQLAATWFGEREVSTATAIGVFGNQVNKLFIKLI